MADLPGADSAAHKLSSAAARRPFTLRDLIGDGMLWAVPRNRRTIERRWKRKFGSPEYVTKLLVPKANLRPCNKCGHDFEVGILCRKTRFMRVLSIVFVTFHTCLYPQRTAMRPFAPRPNKCRPRSSRSSACSRLNRR